MHLKHDLLDALDHGQMPGSLDAVIHGAAAMDSARTRTDLFRVNTAGTLELLEYARVVGARKFVFLSTGGVYGYSTEPLSERSPARPLSFYALTKHHAELLVQHYVDDLSPVIIRLFFPYGPGQQRGIVPLLAARIENRERVEIYNAGNPKIQPVFVDDAARAVEAALALDGSHVLNVSGDEVTDIRSLAEALGRHMGTRPQFERASDDSQQDLRCDNALAKQLLGVEPTVTLNEGIERYVQARGPE